MAGVKNLEKLYLIPVLAIRNLLISKFQNDETRISQLRRLRQEELIAEVARRGIVSEAEIEKLYENYRYGRRLSLQLFLIPGGFAETIDKSDIESIITGLHAHTDTEQLQEQPGELDDDYSADSVVGRVAVCDHTTFGSTVEIRFKYLIRHRFLNHKEEPSQVLETRFGFVWLCARDQYLAVLAKDDSITKQVISILATALKILPKAVQFPKELVDEHFPIDTATRLMHLDPATGVRQSISGDAEALSGYLPEIQSREHRFLRPGGLYLEQIEDTLHSGLGLTTKKGKLYFTRTLSTSQVHRWVESRLSEFVADLHHYLDLEPERVFQATAILARRRRLSSTAKMHLERIGDAVLKAKRESQQSVRIRTSFREIYAHLGSQWLQARLSCPCPECDESCDSCTACGSSALALNHAGHLTCQTCDHDLMIDDKVKLCCSNSHVHEFPLDESLGYLPTHALAGIVIDLLQSAGMAWDSKREALYFEGNTVHYLVAPADTAITNVYGDQIHATVGAGARNVAIGKGITLPTNGL